MKSVSTNKSDETPNFCEKYSSTRKKTKQQKKEKFSDTHIPYNEPYKKPKRKCYMKDLESYNY